MLVLVPERGEPINADNPTGGTYQLTFGGGFGLAAARVGRCWIW